jgi:hypothetical protein
MDNSYDNIQAHIQHARQLRSDAMGELLSAGLKKAVALIKSLVHHTAPALATRS